MKLSEYAKTMKVTYKTAWNWWKAGYLEAYQIPSGTIMVDEEKTKQRMVEKGKWKQKPVQNVTNQSI